MALDPWQIDFLDKLRQTGNDPPWTLHAHHGFIRRGGDTDCECPATAVIRQYTGERVPLGTATLKLANVINIRLAQSLQIVVTSDNWITDLHFNAELRAALLEATGLNKEKENV